MSHADPIETTTATLHIEKVCSHCDMTIEMHCPCCESCSTDEGRQCEACRLDEYHTLTCAHCADYDEDDAA